MTVTSVVRPLPGPGLVARSGDLLLVCSEGTDATRAEVEQLLNLIPEVAAAGGDGTVLVRRVAALLAADLDGLFPDCAVCGPAPDGRLAVLVYGAATARVVGRDGEVRLSAVDVVASVNRLVPGPITAIRLELPGAGQPSRFARLEGGVVSAAGFVAGEETSGGTVSAVPAQPGPATEAARFEPSAPAIPPPSASPETVTPAPIVTPAPPAEEPAPASPVAPAMSEPPAIVVPAAPEPEPAAAEPEPVFSGPDPSGAVVPGSVGSGLTVPEPAGSEPAASEPAASEPVVAEPVVPEPAASEPVASEPVVPEPMVPEPMVPEPVVPEPVVEASAPGSEPALAEPAPSEPSGWTPPEPSSQEPATPESDGDAPPSWAGPSVVNAAIVPSDAPPPPAPSVSAPPLPTREPLATAPIALGPRPTVLGLACSQGHLNDPSLTTCVVCGAGLVTQPPALREGPRPPLGVITMDDGTQYLLDTGYVLGREPQHDPEVVAGGAKPLKIIDVEGVVSRRHLRVALVGWDIQIIDLGSSNGTYVQYPDDPQLHRLEPHHAIVVKAGTTVTMGRRTFRIDPVPPEQRI